MPLKQGRVVAPRVGSVGTSQAKAIIFRIRRSFVRVVQLLRYQFGHGEHVDLVLPKNLSHLGVADDESLVTRVLQIICLDIRP